MKNHERNRFNIASVCVVFICFMFQNVTALQLFADEFATSTILDRSALRLETDVRDGEIHWKVRALNLKKSDGPKMYDCMVEAYALPGPTKHAILQGSAAVSADWTGGTSVGSTLTKVDIRKDLLIDGSEQRGIVLRIFGRLYREKGPRHLVDEIYLEFPVPASGATATRIVPKIQSDAAKKPEKLP